jgi:signal transduction histidine kinase
MSHIDVPMFCLFDAKGVLSQRNCKISHDQMIEMTMANVSRQFKQNDDTFRVRVFEAEPQGFILTGYAAQRAVISRKDIDSLMQRLAVLQVLGLLILGYFLGSRLFSPLRALGNGIEKVAHGEWKEIPLDRSPMAGSGEEIESVGRSFNKMVIELSSAQQRLIEVQKELAKKDKLAALGRFSAGIAHEINNPLGTILANAGLLKDLIESGQKPELEEIEEIISEVKRCKNIISTLRTYTSKTSPSLELHDISKAFHLLARKITSNPEFAYIDVKLVHKASGQVLIDMSAMGQVFYNLAKNASESFQEDKTEDPSLIISSSVENDHILISFADNGPGFSCEPELMFEPLFTTKARGTGLGLIICQAIVEGHGGKITAERKDGYTEMNVMLPFAENTEKEQDKQNED